MSLRFATWNVLADCYVHGQTVVDEMDFQARTWSIRSAMIQKCISNFDADVCCLQEVDHFESFYRPMLKDLGYKSLFVKRPSKHDGCLVSYRTERFNLLMHKELNLDTLSFIDGDRKSSKSKFFKNNVAIFVTLKDLVTDWVFIVANCHIHWNPALEDVKCAQVAYLLEQLAEFRADNDNAPILWAGDFNSMPHSDVYRIITARGDHRHHLLQTVSPLHIARNIGAGTARHHNPYYGPHTRFLCDASLSRLCRWMRMLGIQVACDSYDIPSETVIATLPPHATGKSSKAMKASYINAFFDKANDEQRVLLTTSKSLLERNTCPRHSRYVDPAKQAQEVIALFHDYGLELSRDRFLTVCGKCGGMIEIARPDDPRMSGKYMPSDREVYACVHCAHPYWWNDEENSSPAKALRKAEELYQMIAQALNIPMEKPRPTPTIAAFAASSTITAVLSTTTSSDAKDLSSSSAPPSTLSTTTTIETGAQIVIKREDISLLNDLRMASPSSPAVAAATSTMTATALSTSAETVLADGISQMTFVSHTEVVRQVEEAAASCDSPIELPEEFRVASAIMRQRCVDALPALVSAFHPDVHDGRTAQQAEPATTNWAGEFIGTLDYVFLTESDWHVQWARVRPLASLNEAHLPSCNSPLPVSTSGNPGDHHDNNPDQLQYINQVIASPQPTALWPSDHFAIITELTFTT